MSSSYPQVKKLYRRGLVVLGLLAVLAWIAVFSLRPDRALKVAVLDVGQGDAILATTDGGSQLLVDGGSPAGGILRRLSQHMPFFDRTLELVVATHADADHIGGLIEVLKRYRVRYVLVGDFSKDTATFREFEDRLAASGAQVVRPQPGLKLWLDNATLLEIIGPPAGFFPVESNETSIVARLRYGKTAIMLTGDAPESEEQAILSSGIPVRANVLKVGHHGSRSSTSQAFLLAVGPKNAVISAGQENRYGHPTEEVLQRLAGYGIKIDRTDKEGTIEYKSDGREFIKL